MSWKKATVFTFLFPWSLITWSGFIILNQLIGLLVGKLVHFLMSENFSHHNPASTFIKYTIRPREVYCCYIWWDVLLIQSSQKVLERGANSLVFVLDCRCLVLSSKDEYVTRVSNFMLYFLVFTFWCVNNLEHTIFFFKPPIFQLNKTFGASDGQVFIVAKVLTLRLIV